MKQENRVNEVMNSLEGIQKAKAPHDGFAKIQQKLAEQRKQQTTIRRQPQHGWMKMAAVISLVVCANIWAVTNYWQSDTMVSDNSGSYPQIVSDYNLYENE